MTFFPISEMFYNSLLKFSEGKPLERLNIKGEKPS